MYGRPFSGPGDICPEEINLLRIESYPLRDRMWEYLFFADFTVTGKMNRSERVCRIWQAGQPLSRSSVPIPGEEPT